MIDTMDELLRQLEVLYEQKEKEVEKTQAILRTQQLALNRIKGMLRAGGLIEIKPKATTKGARTPSAETHANIVRAVEAVEGEVIEGVPSSFTAPQIAEASGHSASVVRRVLDKMRDEGTIRLAGTSTRTGKPAQVFARVTS